MAASPLPVHTPERERLAPPGLILGLAFGILLTLGILFDPRAFMQRIRSGGHSEVTLYFLKALLATTNDNEIRILLTRREIRAGHYQAALRTLEPLIEGRTAPAYRQTVRWLTYNDLLAVTFTHPAQSEARRAGERQLRLMIPALQADLHGARLSELAANANTIHDGAAAVGIYRELAARHATRRALYYRLAADAALGMGHGRAAARLYFRAQSYALSVSERQKDFERGLHALEQANDSKGAILAATIHVGRLDRDRAVLRFLVSLARRANEPTLAAHYARLLIGMMRL